MVHGVVYWDMKHNNSLINILSWKPLAVEFFETKIPKNGCCLTS